MVERRRSRISEDFKVSQKIMDQAMADGWPDPRQHVEEFKAYHAAKGSLMADWESAFRLWMMRVVIFAQDRGKPVKAMERPQAEMNLKPSAPKEPEPTPEELSARRRKVGVFLHDLVKQMDVRHKSQGGK
jgi:hypothetical protein